MGMINGAAIAVSFLEMFILGIMVGYEASKRNDPNQPKPKNWSEKLQKEWMDGFKAGEKSMAKRITRRLNKEELYSAAQDRWLNDDQR